MNQKKLLSTVLIVCIFLTSLNISYAIEAKDSKLSTRVEKIVVKSDTWVHITFNDAIKPIQASNIKIYEYVKKTSIKFEVSTISDTEIKLHTDVQKPATIYIIELTNITNSKGIVVKKIASSFNGYENTEIKSDLFKISKVEQISNNSMLIYFTHPINTDAEQPAAFSLLNGEKVIVTGNNVNLSVTKIKDKPNALIIYLKKYTLKSDIEYTLKVNGSLLSAYGTCLGQETGDQINFIGVTALNNISDATKQHLIYNQKDSFKALDDYSGIPEIVSIVPIDLNCIIINFNRNLDPTLAQDTTSYSLYRPYSYETLPSYNEYGDLSYKTEALWRTEQPIKSVYSSDSPNLVKLYFWYDSPMIPVSKCSLTIASDLHTGATLSNQIVYEFTAANVYKTNPAVAKAIFIASDTLKISFDKDIAQYSFNILPENYIIEAVNDSTIKLPLAVTYFDRNTIVLKFDKIDLKKRYYLKYYRLIDITGETYSGEKINTEIIEGT